MAVFSADDKSPEEALVHGVIVGTWGLWAFGAVYHAYPILAWGLAGLAFARRFGLTSDDRPFAPLPLGVWVWMAGSATMALALIMGQLSFDFGVLEIIKSLFGWVKGWALLAALPYAGATLRIRPQVLFRAMNILALQTLILTPIFLLGSAIGLPPVLYTSPLQYLGGAGETFFEVGTHWIDPGSPDVRLRYYAPWAPAAALAAQISLVLALFDRDWRWRTVGIVSAVVVCWFAKSRLSVVGIPVLLLAIPALSQIHRPIVIGLTGVASVVGAFTFSSIVRLIEQATTTFNSARADSSRVRSTLQRIAYDRWGKEAPIFGHGAVERGPHLVEFMPIGSHHTWCGLLFVKGAVGFAALAIPMAWTFIEMMIKAQKDRVARAALGITLVLFVNSFGENLEILAYLTWPGLLLIGIAMNRRRVGIMSSPLGTATLTIQPAELYSLGIPKHQ
jgi:hypothetical protein